MVAPRRRVQGSGERRGITNGLYVHSSPPRVLNALTSAHIRHLVLTGDIERLEQLVLDGQGSAIAAAGTAPPADARTRSFLRTSAPALMARVRLLHDAVAAGSLNDLQVLLAEDASKRKKLAMCKDPAGVGLLHKAMFYDLKDIAKWLLDNFPQTCTLKDAEGRTAVHYSAMCKDPREMQRLLSAAGADLYATDSHGHNYKYYVDNPSELELPSAHIASTTVKTTPGKDGLMIKPANIRIWIHQRDLGRLQKVLWDGHGAKLRREHSNSPRVKRFLEAVPYLMGAIKDIHTAAINNDIELLKERTAEPTPPIILSSKDSHGLTALHKAAGLGHTNIVNYILEIYPDAVSITDAEGRTPLHYSVLLKDDDQMYNTLINAGAEESSLDNRSKTAAYYRTRPNELEAKLLQKVPDAPRTATSGFPPGWDWSLLTPQDDSSRSSKKSDTVFGVTPTEEKKVEEELDADKTPDEPEREPEPDSEIEPETESQQEPPSTSEQVSNIEHDNSIEETKENGVEEEKKEEPEENEVEPEVVETKPEPKSEPDPEQEEDEIVEPELNTINSEEKNVDDDEVVDGRKSETPESQKIGVIEGVVNGEDEVETLNNDENKESARNEASEEEEADLDPDSEITTLVELGDMEQLASLVLRGEGSRLAGHQASSAELQAFLDNVPVYMAKIRRVHVAAREGELRELQAALDRRKFAIARDAISPAGATPLHVAAVFGHTAVLRYLAGRFPETLLAVDEDGRTPLHYAATLSDNGHYYNLLLHLGANAHQEDNFGRTAEYYKTHTEEFSHRHLLQRFGAEPEQAEALLQDKDNANSNPQVDIPLFRTEEGRYLASSLGDPLIKGLTEVANKRPEDPIAYLATYLYNFANSNRGRLRTQERGQMNKPDTPQENQQRNIDVVTIDPGEENDGNENESSDSAIVRDEHGQSMLHFAAARAHGRNALFQLLQETAINLGLRDELYRTARDISVQANAVDNTIEIDRYVVALAARGETASLLELLLEGYDHLVDITDEDGIEIAAVVAAKGENDTVAFLQSILAFEERRERVHHAIRQGHFEQVREMLSDEEDTGSGRLLAVGKNSYGRCTLHIAVLCQHEELVDFLANSFPDTLHVGDNLERTPLHYAMGVESVDALSRLLVDAGARRVTKDLKGRQPSYYFMNKADILRLQEEEETF